MTATMVMGDLDGELTRLDQEMAALDLEALRDQVSHQVMELAVKPKPKRARTKRGPSANQPLADLVSSLARAGWGVMDGREWRPVRSLLEALARMMARDAHSDRKGTITTTVRQLMTQSGYKDRQTRKALHWMEDMGLIVWWRGGVVDGKPQPGVLRVVKTKLVEWINLARPIHDEAERRHRDDTARRLRRLRSLRVAPRLPRSIHAARSADLSSLRERAGAPSAPAPSPTPPITDKETPMPTTTKGTLPESVRLTRLRDQYMRNQGITSPEDVAWAHANSANVQDWDRRIAAARKQERRPEEDLTDAQLW